MNLAIYTHVLNVSGQCMSVSLILDFKLNYSSYANLNRFCKSSHAVDKMEWHGLINTADHEHLL